MTENELFEHWFMGKNIKNSLGKEPEGHYTYAPANIAWNVWKARAELAEKQIAELQAQINDLRKALEKVIFHAEFREQDEDTARAVAIGQLIVIEELANEYLAKTAPQCLQESETSSQQETQEPVDVARVQEDGYVEWREGYDNLPVGTNLYTHPLKRLTDDEVAELWVVGMTPYDWVCAVQDKLLGVK